MKKIWPAPIDRRRPGKSTIQSGRPGPKKCGVQWKSYWKILRTMEIRRRPGKSTIQILTRADPRRSSAAGRENLQSKSASVAVVAVAAVVVATRESRLCRQSQTAWIWNSMEVILQIVNKGAAKWVFSLQRSILIHPRTSLQKESKSPFLRARRLHLHYHWLARICEGGRSASAGSTAGSTAYTKKEILSSRERYIVLFGFSRWYFPYQIWQFISSCPTIFERNASLHLIFSKQFRSGPT